MSSTLDDELAVAVVGAGPAGVGVGVVLRDLGIERFALLERDDVGASFRRWPDEMRLLTPSFPSNTFGARDLNAVTLDTSPAFALNREHPSGDEYAEYLEAVVEFHDVPVRAGIDVREVAPDDGGFALETSAGTIESEFVVWAAGQFQYPNRDPFPGADACVHNATVGSWRSYADGCDGDRAVVVGGAESGIDAALALSERGLRVAVIDETGPWRIRSPDPSEVLSPYTAERLEAALEDGAEIDLVADERVTRAERTDDGGYAVLTDGDRRFVTDNRPVLATGFDGSVGLVEDLFELDEGHPALTDRDESTETPGLFLVGPTVRHDGQQFCFVYKFRQRFAAVADEIARRLGVDREPLDAYREKDMFLEDLSCCDPELCDC
ncbi:NAD(P)/FAD-dependent oxidoreductase [Halegenticoccus tardaugens]|uniref:NAD(P)/FAD-dependent oxidoreductase n=1 Tax=Halegenticoccus tardaugens TaxID=2071624 RepID=UPI00100ACEE3|nr:NAD(P)/FAD-dependent oxidoreductase [Halegenticoccus tardaugens]